MGLTAESAHIHVGEGFPGAVRNRTMESVREQLRRQGFVEVENQQESDRTVTLGPAEGQRWISVLDTQIGSLEELARSVSQDLGATAVSAMVFDSDDVFLSLMRNGKQVDRFERSEGRTRRADPERWPGDAAAFREALKDRPVFAEEQLARLAEALGIEAQRCLTPGGEAEGEGFIHLYFRHRSSANKPKDASGSPVFRSSGAIYPPFELGVGEKLWQAMTGYVTNMGGPGTGVRITVGGTAVEDELIRVDAVHVFQAGIPRVAEVRLEGACSAEFPDLKIGAGVIEPEPGNIFQLIGQLRKQQKQVAERATMVSSHASGEAITPGQGTLILGFEPLDNPVRGGASQQFSLIVRPRVRVPLRANAAMPGTQQYMRWMEDPRHVVAIGSLALVPGVRAAALEAIEAWAGFLQPLRGDRWHLLQSGSGLLSLPKTYTSRSSGLAADQKWKKVRVNFEDCAGCSGHLGEEVRDGSEIWEGCAGWGFDTSAMQAKILGGVFSPQLAFGLDTHAFQGEDVIAAEEAVAAIFDRLLEQGILLQAFQARWRCGNVSAVYEMACGVQGQCTAWEPWCKRYLRGVGPRVWLGPELRRELGEESERGRRIDWPGSLDELETRLAPILAGRTDWEQGARDMYQGRAR